MKRIVFCVLATAVLLATAVGASADVRPARLAGSWYPADPDELRSSVEGFINRADAERPEGRPVALAAPHAGHAYSGATAGETYALLQEAAPDVVVLVGPSHRVGFPGVSVNTLDYETPLGRVENARGLAAEIIEAGGGFASTRPRAHESEHCLEIQLPFIQVAAPEARIVPIIMGGRDMAACRRLADILAAALKGRNAVLVCSTDLSHFHPANEAEEMDRRLIDHVKAMQPERLHAALSQGRVEACGGGPLTAVMLAAQKMGADRAAILEYTHSGRTTGDDSRVVGYLAAAFLDSKSKGSSAGPDEPGVHLGLDRADQKRLLGLARRSIEAALEGKEYRPPEDLPAALRRKRGAFVSLKTEDGLRGCIGRLTAEAPLAETVCRMAVQAAFHDPRFSPLRAAEYGDLSVEISVLTPFEPVRDVSEIEVGRHGLLVEKGFHRGLLLPQVPVELGWDRREFLRQTCRKAGLPPDAWKEARLMRFSAQVFGEED
jgi:AmmeMemoRadiSam system protein B/AmmeMemoRadiSam system protein A